jgi:two-component sensor histidine kinase
VVGGRVLVSYRIRDNETVLSVEDNGVGGIEASAAASSGIGGTLMAAFAKQVHGQLEEVPSASGGHSVRIRMPRTNGVTGLAPPPT